MFETDRKRPRLHESITIEIPGRPPTLNSRRHWRTVARDNAEWKAMALVFAAAAREEWEARHALEWTPIGDALVTVTFAYPTRAVKDWDNLVSTLKPLFDGIVAAGVLIDDSIRVIRRITLEARHTPHQSSTIFGIAEPIDE